MRWAAAVRSLGATGATRNAEDVLAAWARERAEIEQRFRVPPAEDRTA
jgi:hypothetical protein